MATFQVLDSNSAAITVDAASTELCALNVASFEVTSAVLPSNWARALGSALRRLAKVTTLSERKSLEFVRLLLSVVDADGGSDASLSISVSGDTVTVSLAAAAGSSVLLSTQRTGGFIKPVSAPPAAGGGGSVDLSSYARKSELPDVSGFARKTELPNLAPYALKTDLPVVTGLLTVADATSTYATKAALAEVSSFAHDRVFFVAKNGNDSMGNGSAGKPFASITKALEAANAVSGGYVRINVAPGEYSENVTVSRARTILAGAGVDPEDHTTSLMGSLTVDCAAATQKYNDVVAVQGFYVNNGAKVTGTGAFLTVFTDCYLTTGSAAVNAVLVDNSHADRSIVYLRNCSVTKQSSATTDIVKLSRGDVRMDTVRVYGAISGTGNGILLNNNATLSADRLQVDHNMTGAGIRVDGSYAGVSLTLSNSSVKSAVPALYLKNDTGTAAFLWQVLLMAGTTSAGPAIDGVYNGLTVSGVPVFPVIYGHLTAGPGNSTAFGTAIASYKLKMSDFS